MAQPSRSPIPSMSTTYNGQWQTRSSTHSRSGGLFGFLSSKIAQWLYPSTSHVDVEEKKSDKVLVTKGINSQVEEGTCKSKYLAAREGAKKLAFSLGRLPFIHPLGRIGTYICANGAFPLSPHKGLLQNARISYEGFSAGLAGGVFKCGTQFVVMSAGEALLRVEAEHDPVKRKDQKRWITIASGLLSEAASAPANHLKTLKNIAKEEHSCLQIIRQNGICHMVNPLNNGTVPMLVRNATWIVPFAYLRDTLNDYIEGGKVTRYVIAGVSGGAACAVSYPIESIRILQAKNLQTWIEGGSKAPKPNYMATVKALTVRKTAQEVVKRLFRGGGPSGAVMVLQGIFIAGMADWNDRAN